MLQYVVHTDNLTVAGKHKTQKEPKLPTPAKLSLIHHYNKRK